MLKLDAERINRTFFDQARQLAEYAERHTRLIEPEADLFTRFISRGDRVLDLGCGMGRTTQPISAMTDSVIGIDLSENMIAAARERHPGIEFRVMDAAELRFPDAAFDVVVFSYNGICCIHPGGRRLQSMREIHRVLRPGGLFIYSVLNRYPPHSLASAINSLVTRCTAGVDEHYKVHVTRTGVMVLYENAPENEISILQSTGFEAIEQQPSEPAIRCFGMNTTQPVWTYFVARSLPRR